MLSDIPDCFYRVSVKGLILDDTRTKFLVVLEDNGKWELPGGGLDWGESPAGCLRREIKEEMGLEVTWVNSQPCYFLAGQKKPNDIWVANVLFETEVKDLNCTFSLECIDIRFVTPEEAKALNAFPNVQELANMFDHRFHIASQ